MDIFTDLKREDAVKVGMELKRLIKTDGFEKVTQIISVQYAQMFYNTDPQKPGDREALHAEARAFDNLINTMHSFVYLYETALERESEEDEAQPTLF